jgi:hypothetical protein
VVFRAAISWNSLADTSVPPSAIALAALAVLTALTGAAGADPAPIEAARWPVAEAPRARAMLDRLVGHHVRWQDGVLAIDDVAGAGRPWIGVVERRGAALWLAGAGFALRLTGPLARPRLAGPRYLIWVSGDRDGDALAVRRLGVLEPPR